MLIMLHYPMITSSIYAASVQATYIVLQLALTTTIVISIKSSRNQGAMKLYFERP
jgi:hypothetical protein